MKETCWHLNLEHFTGSGYSSQRCKDCGARRETTRCPTCGNLSWKTVETPHNAPGSTQQTKPTPK